MKISELGAHVDVVTTEETGGNCQVDLVHLKDGRVVGITSDSLVLYPNEQEFWDCTKQDLPTIYLTKEKEEPPKRYKYLELEVQYPFDEHNETLFDALNRAARWIGTSKVSRKELRDALVNLLATVHDLGFSGTVRVNTSEMNAARALIDRIMDEEDART